MGPRSINPTRGELAAATPPYGDAPSTSVWLRVVPGAVSELRGLGAGRDPRAWSSDRGRPAWAGGHSAPPSRYLGGNGAEGRAGGALRPGPACCSRAAAELRAGV